MALVDVEMQVVEGDVRLQLKPWTPKEIVIDCESFGPHRDAFLLAAREYIDLKCKSNASNGEWTIEDTTKMTPEEWNKTRPILDAYLERLNNSESHNTEWTVD